MQLSTFSPILEDRERLCQRTPFQITFKTYLLLQLDMKEGYNKNVQFLNN